MPNPEWSVNNVEARDSHTLRVWFEDGSIKDVDFAPLFRQKPFTALRREALFRKAHVFAGSVAWNTRLDIAPEYLYEHGIDINK